jgi:hypothetical protein
LLPIKFNANERNAGRGSDEDKKLMLMNNHNYLLKLAFHGLTASEVVLPRVVASGITGQPSAFPAFGGVHR